MNRVSDKDETGREVLTKVEEEQFGRILRAVMATPDKEVRPNLSSGMRQSAMEDVKLYLTPK